MGGHEYLPNASILYFYTRTDLYNLFAGYWAPQLVIVQIFPKNNYQISISCVLEVFN